MYMRSIRILGAAALLGGIAALIQSACAADPIPDAEFKALAEEDAKNIVAWCETAKAKEKLKSANRTIKSNTLVLALAAQMQMTGKNATDDARFVTIRNTALDVAKSAGAKKYNDAFTTAKTISLNMPAGKGKVGPMPVADLVTAVGLDVDDLMNPFRLANVGGYGIEKEIQDNAQKKAATPPNKAGLLARRVLLIADVVEVIPFSGDNNQKLKKDWADVNKDMKAAGSTLLAAAGTKNAKDIQAAFAKLETTCVACHRQFKK